MKLPKLDEKATKGLGLFAMVVGLIATQISDACKDQSNEAKMKKQVEKEVNRQLAIKDKKDTES